MIMNIDHPECGRVGTTRQPPCSTCKPYGYAHELSMSWSQRIVARAACARRTWGLCTPCAVVISLGLPLDLLRRSGADTLAHSQSTLPATGSIENP